VSNLSTWERATGRRIGQGRNFHLDLLRAASLSL
jgi:hypothetical protein